MSADQIDYYYLDSLNSATGTAVETANAYGFLPVPDVEDLEQDIPLFYPDEQENLQLTRLFMQWALTVRIQLQWMTGLMQIR